MAPLPHKTLFHELAHVVLGHTEEKRRMDDDEHTPVNIREVEAECVTLICCESLGLSGAEFCRGYIQHWLGKDTIPDRSAQRIFKASDLILKAGCSIPAPSDPTRSRATEAPGPSTARAPVPMIARHFPARARAW